MAEPISFKFSGKYENSRNLREPKLRCAWWDELNFKYNFTGVEATEISYDAVSKEFSVNCLASHLTTFTVVFEEGFEAYTTPLWWYDLITTSFVAITLIFLIGVYVSYIRNASMFIPVQYKTTLFLYLTIFLYVISYLLGQFIGTAHYPSTREFDPAGQVMVVLLNNYFTLCILTMFFLNLYTRYTKGLSSDSMDDTVSFFVKVSIIGCYVAPLVIVCLNVGIVAAVKGEGVFLRDGE